MSKDEEQYVDAETLAHFLGETRRYVLYLARTGVIRSYPMSGRMRIIRKFRISEVTHDLVGRHRKIRRKQDKGDSTKTKKSGKGRRSNHNEDAKPQDSAYVLR